MTGKLEHAFAWLPGLCTTVTACGLLAACGQKGPLMLPEPTESEIAQDAAEPGGDQQEDEDDDAGGN